LKGGVVGQVDAGCGLLKMPAGISPAQEVDGVAGSLSGDGPESLGG